MIHNLYETQTFLYNPVGGIMIWGFKTFSLLNKMSFQSTGKMCERED